MTIPELLARSRKITIIGLSPDPARASHGVARYLIDQGYEIVGVRPSTDSVLGRPVYPSLAEAPAPLGIVDVFRASQHVPALVDELTRPGAPAVDALWLQEGVTHPEAEEKARRAGIMVVSDRCILKEHKLAQIPVHS